jgi:fatty acid amide hydrolase
MMGQRSRPTLAALGSLLRLFGQRGLAAPLGSFGHGDTHHYWSLVEAQLDYQRRFAQALDQGEGGPFDLILGPACALPAFRHGASRELMTAGGYTALYNLLGYPAGVVPFTRVRAGEETERPPSRDVVEQTACQVEQGSAGLPVGVQVIARPWRDHVALAAMLAIEKAARTRDGFPALPPV